MPAKTQKTPLLREGEFEVKEVVELAFFDLTGEKAKTRGTSNKSYHAEINVAKKGNKAQIYTMWGPTGGNQTKDWRHYNSEYDAKKDFDSIIKSKKKKGYQEIDVAQRAIGSTAAKSITKAVQLNNVDDSAKDKVCTLHLETQRLIGELMGATNQFVITTLKCPLGQLTNAQIDVGRDKLKSARAIVQGAKRLSADKKKQLVLLTNDFYSAIPHNLGVGSRGQMTDLILDTEGKINKKEYDLDTLLDAKAIGATLQSNSVLDQYKSLDTSFDFIDHNEDIFKWLNAMIQETRASNHRYLGKISLLNAWKIQRNGEKETFLKTANRIAGECGRQVIPGQMKTLVGRRADVEDKNLFRNANVIPLFHGTRTQNLTGILKKGMLIRPSGVVITGAMYGNSIYKSASSTKSINYTNVKTSYWAKGNDDKGYLFISDCALGNQLLASGPRQFTLKNIHPHHSVWAKGGRSGVINDEMMLYRTDQHNIRYLLEFSCKGN
jgi:poly [ADP-ribose] polymerase